jgi:hypothetical protein
MSAEQEPVNETLNDDFELESATEKDLYDILEKGTEAEQRAWHAGYTVGRRHAEKVTRHEYECHFRNWRELLQQACYWLDGRIPFEGYGEPEKQREELGQQQQPGLFDNAATQPANATKPWE